MSTPRLKYLGYLERVKWLESRGWIHREGRFYLPQPVPANPRSLKEAEDITRSALRIGEGYRC